MRMIRCVLSAVVWSGLALAAGAGGERLRSLAGESRRDALINPKSDFILPELADGAGVATLFTVVNLDTKSIQWKLYFGDPNGVDLPLPIVELQGGATNVVGGTLPVGASVSFSTTGAAPQVTEGWAALQLTDGKASVTATIVQGSLDAQAIVNLASSAETRFSMPFNNRGPLRTGIIVLHPDSADAPPATVTFVARDEDAAELVRQTVTIAPLRQRFLSLSDVFPATAGKAGTLEVSSVSRRFSAIGLRISPNGFVTFYNVLSLDSVPDAPQRPSTPPATLPGISPACDALEGALVFADDGQFVGKITSNKFAPDSLGNEFGRYGTDYSTTSIFNPFGRYGGDYSSASATNPTAPRPPVIFSGGNPVAFLTANSGKTPWVDINAVLSCVGRK